MQILTNCFNALGQFDPVSRTAIRAYITNPMPTSEDWEKIANIIIDASSKHSTVWGVLIELDYTFPLTGRIRDIDGDIVEDWARIPTGFELARAITNHFRKTEIKKGKTG